jgi:hypothetical protein
LLHEVVPQAAMIGVLIDPNFWTAKLTLPGPCLCRQRRRRGGRSNTEIRKHTTELAALAPDVFLAVTSTLGPLLEVTRTVPIVFTLGTDPVGAGFVDNLARPGGNVTGFMSYEFSMAGKWLELLKQIAPGVTRVAILRDASQAFAIAGAGGWRRSRLTCAMTARSSSRSRVSRVLRMGV